MFMYLDGSYLICHVGACVHASLGDSVDSCKDVRGCNNYTCIQILITSPLQKKRLTSDLPWYFIAFRYQTVVLVTISFTIG